ncbi:MAG: DEAD/DEAH box helicase [Corynebacterium flavescens]|uniref:DEAD/DEAH box helicase n=1 Tax=Corynebacterium flavescens TaxID=28028 RepID=UPI002647D4A7|nr:DEAD/DEAH box helicase [Corynebacterium flavescens]MDN6199146.1 DEAD/DEAH box helicase [Corynebacterium flavescens]MDN6225795.1 DEAD/DEAH box helicase [Corynebacterium flavescens]MDN6235571.1 DEAD/DEAH box helicase [Corynebacterium flavescens]MDN6551878.1 DEAD/DEAH box helicase [Corynebacterium flavescens]MDN6645373.1 DEAD/DEAH box helicase [Corynebacterium flavescens]
MASYLLHGLWLPVSGLSLWIEQVEGHKIVLPSAVPDGAFPEAVEALLKKKSFRNRARVSLRTPKGKDVSLMVPMAMFAPEEAVSALAGLSILDDGNAAASPQQRESIASDLFWLIRAYRGLRAFVRAGRVTIRLSYQAGEWYPMWQLASGLGERGWLGEMIAAAPGILSINNRSLSEDLAEELTHWIAYVELRHLTQAARPYPWHDFAQALLTTSPVKRGRAQLLRGLNEWKDSITSVDLQLVFIVEEPPKDEDPGQSAWPIRVQVRSGTDSPQPIRLDSLDRTSVERLREDRRKAIAIAPVLGESQLPVDPDAGDWDVYLRTDSLVSFIGADAAALKAAGFTVMLPKAWAQMETKAKLETREVRDPAEGSTKAHLGMDKLVEYDWHMSVGDIELSDEEMQQLVESKSGLIRLRGDWVMADTQSISKISEYMEELAQTANKRAKKELERLAAAAEMARQLEQPGWQELVADVEKRRQEFNDGQIEQVSVAELRELALTSMAQEPIEFTGSTWQMALLGGMSTQAPERIELPETIHAELREYQRRGVDWLYWMSRNNIGAVLADDMGLGKTLQLLSLVAVEKTRAEAAGPTLIIAPTSVVGNWAREAKKFVPDFRVLVQHGSDRLRGKQLVDEAAKMDLVITSYGTAGRDFAVLGQVEWDRVVLDEAQAIKNAATRSSKAVRSLPSRHRVALTGTPVENRLSEMRSILDFCNPGVLGSASFFRNHFAKAIEREGSEVMSERLRQLTAPFILRRLKTDPSIIDDLPEKSEQIVTVSMTEEQAALYKALVDDVQKTLNEKHGIARRGLVLASLTRIKQICNHPAHYLGDGSAVTIKGRHRSGKVKELMRIVDGAVESNERLLIFTQYRAFGSILQPYLSQQLGREIPFLHGGVTKNKRDQMVEDFQSPDGPPAMILSLKAGGTGLNLTAANIVVHMDRWWNPAVENQATDRAFRIGQQRNVQVYKMITAGTLEESIQDILDGKTQLAGAVVGEGEGWLTELDPEQLAQLMSYKESD